MRKHDGYLSFFGAPPGAPVALPTAVRGQDPETQALAFLGEHAVAFGVTSPNFGFICIFRHE
jgi:hypothetical protein